MNKLVSASLFVALTSSAAFAQPIADGPDTAPGFDHAVPAIDHAFELAVTPGFTQSTGKLGGDLGDASDITGPGGALEIDLGYRVIPQLAVGAYTSIAKFQRGDAFGTGTRTLGLAAGVQAAWHFRPDRSIDPWVSLGTGWKALWIDPTNSKDTSLQGLELARLQLGADYRVSPTAAISPVLGGSMTMFVSQDSPMTTDFTEIHDKKLSWTWFAGMSGRFDFGGRQ